MIKALLPPTRPFRRACALLLLALLSLSPLQAGEIRVISLNKEANRGFRDDDGTGWTGQGENDLRHVTPGRLQVQHLPFELIDPRQNGGRSVLALRSGGETGFAARATIDLNGEKFQTLYLLHTAAWARAANNKEIGRVVFHYDEGEPAAQPIIGGNQVGDWWSFGSGPETEIVPLDNVSPKRDRVYLFAAPVANPHPQRPIRSVTLEAGETRAIWLVLSLLGAPEGVPALERITVEADNDRSGWKEFIPGIGKSRPEAVSLEFLLDAPAGKHGFVKVVNGHFQFENGQPVRFWGTNLHADHTLFPTHEEAEQVADTLARYGCNIVRIHYPEKALISLDATSSETMVSEEQWERFEYLLFTLKKKGIYLMMESIGGLGRRFRPDDGVRLPPAHGETYFQPRLQELAHRFMKELLGRKNRYTGLSLANDPALALVSIQNERSIFWNAGGTNMTPEAAADFRVRYNQWLLEQYHDRAGLAKTWSAGGETTALLPEEDPAHGSVLFPNAFAQGGEPFLKAVDPKAAPQQRARARTEVAFLKFIQEDHYRSMREAGRQLGLRVPVIGTNIVQSVAEMDTMRPFGVSAQNMYWDHLKATDGGFRYHNRPEVTNSPLRGGTQVTESTWLQKISGLATVSPENDAMWPNEWRSSHLMMNGATAALQDADALFQFAFGGGGGNTWEIMKARRSIVNPTISYNDPATIASFVSGAFLFLRGDVSTSSNLVSFPISEAALFSTVPWLRDGTFPANYLPFVSRYELTFPGDRPAHPPTLVVPNRGTGTRDNNQELAASLDLTLKEHGLLALDRGLQDGKLISDTGELVRDWKHELFLVNTPKSQGFTGFPRGGEPLVFDDVKIESRSPFATLQLSSLDEQPLARAEKIFLLAVARADNRDSRWTFSQSQPMPMGGTRGEDMLFVHDARRSHAPAGPVLIEPVAATLTLKGERFRLTPLGPDMTPIASQAKEFRTAGEGQTAVEIGGGDFSIWYLLERLP
ncbi:MAG TPA: hypothetical protein VNQ90_04335 [Chthoniobacteraceae bacterium]|nr:hypothetical protein [Chthoniobacteraceae bacterium]